MTRSTRFPIRWTALLVLVLIPILCQAPASAATLTWPGSAPCDTTLQACVDAAAINDVVQIGSGAGEITDSLVISKPITLRSAPLARGRFRNTTVSIQSSFAGTGNVNVLENVQLINTPISVSLGSNEPIDQHVVELNQLDISGLAGLTAGISVATPQTASQKTLRIRHLRFVGGHGVGYNGSPPSVSVEIADSQFIKTTVERDPVTFVLDGNQQFRFRRNRIESLNHDIGACLTLHALAGATVSAEIDRNLINGCEAGVSLVAQSGATALQARVRNNTIRTRLFGVTVSGTSASAEVDNNIFSRVATFGVEKFAGAQVLAAHNLYHQTPQTLVGEIGWVVADPLFASTYDFHLTPASPAINAGLASSIPAGGDFDGVTGTVPTIGAHDYQFGGADLHRATAENSVSNITNLPTSMSRPLSEVMVQSVIEGFPLPAWAPNHLGVYSFITAPSRTVIFSQNQQSISPPRQFFVLDSNRHQTLSHTADVSNISAHVAT
ncbi:MAG: hypothetical protein IPG63_10890 [Xanthomonadales bacterium]|nr:hypothetical protein [Xanthomonadales bacterium]